MQDKSYLNVAIDLGTESVKIVCAYKTKEGKVERHFLADTDGFSDQPFSSLALFAGPPQNKWVFGQDINKKDDYANIVRVKEMLYLLTSDNNGDREYYEDENHFPIFIFPPKPDQPSIKDGIVKLVNDGYTFTTNTSPKDMVREFFKALFERCINKQVEKILKSNPHLAGVKYISVYPDPKTIKKRYIKELEEMIAYGAGITDLSLVSSISAPQAVAIGAYTEKKIKATDYANDDNKTLIFDIGEKDISVAKVDVKSSASGKKGEISICVEGTDGHEQALAIGGADIDNAIGEFIKGKTTNAGSNSIAQDYMSYRQQYHLLRFVKSAKKHLIRFDYAYVTVEKDVNYNEKITREDFENIVFKNEDSVGGKIIDYVITELKREGNENVKTVLLVGGGAASYHLCDYLEQRCKSESLDNISVSAIDNSQSDISEYFSAIGAAMLEPSGLELKVVSAYAYGSWRYQVPREDSVHRIVHRNIIGQSMTIDEKIFNVWLNRGDELTDEASSSECTSSTAFRDYMYKLNKRVNTEKEEERELGFRYIEPIIIGCRIENPLSFSRSYIEEQKRIDKERLERAKKQGLKLIGNKDADYIMVKMKILNRTTGRYEYLNDRYGDNLEKPVWFKQGIRIDNDGNVVMFYENDVEKNKEVKNTVKDSYGNTYDYTKIEFEHDFGSFKLETN
jgi:hypothetical protein